MDATLTTGALAGAEAVINKALEYDPGSRQALGKLQGQVLAVHLSTPELSIYLIPEQSGLKLSGYWEAEPAAQVWGSLSALIRMARSDHSNLKTSGVRIEGNTGLLQALQEIMKNLDIDWEEALSQLLGDIPGHGGAELLRKTSSWVRDRSDSGRRLLGEFITEELRLLPARQELEDFYRSVDQLRLDLDRAEARLHLLGLQLKPQQTPRADRDAGHKD